MAQWRFYHIRDLGWLVCLTDDARRVKAVILPNLWQNPCRQIHRPFATLIEKFPARYASKRDINAKYLDNPLSQVLLYQAIQKLPMVPAVFGVHFASAIPPKTVKKPLL
jgi:hypothetical protein